MKHKAWIVAVALLILGAAALLLWPRGNRTIEETRTAVVSEFENDGEACPVNFEALQRINGDIYAWLYIPGTEINQPLLQRNEDSSYYLTHNSLGRKDQGGALFTESAYNRKDFSDPATVIYGEGTLFGSLQTSYSSLVGLEAYDEIIVYLPEREIRYQVFAAVPFRSYHLLYYFHFGNAGQRQEFLRLVSRIKTVDANWNKEIGIGANDPLLILSTPRRGDPSNSYLVLAKRIQDRIF